MALEVYDYRTDLCNVMITPAIRSRFEYLEPGTVTRRHSHDLGCEVWIVMQGRIEFEIEGERAVLEPGKMIIARPDQKHSARVVGSEPVIQYLSVTPHVRPTHTFYDEGGAEVRPGYRKFAEERDASLGTAVPKLIDRHLEEVSALEGAVAEAVQKHETVEGELHAAHADKDGEKAKEVLDALWPKIRSLSRQYFKMVKSWNELTGQIAEV